MPAATSTSWQLALDDTTAVRSPASRTAWTYRTEPSYGSTPSSCSFARRITFFALPSDATVGGSVSGASPGSPSGSVIPRDARKERTPSSRGLPSTYAS